MSIAQLFTMPSAPAPLADQYVSALRRHEKAARIADVLDAWGFTSRQLYLMSPRQWELTAQAICEKPPSPLTQALICRAVEARERARAKVEAERGARR